jgi:hypothetical protein
LFEATIQEETQLIVLSSLSEGAMNSTVLQDGISFMRYQPPVAG